MIDRQYIAWLHTQPCAECGSSFMIEAHHHTHGPTEDGRPRGMSQKASDAFAFTLCRKHHSQFHAASGPFKRWDRAERRAWQDKQVAAHRARYLGSEEQYGT